jgi:hypothetical protein
MVMSETWPSWWGRGKASGERWWEQRGVLGEREAVERLYSQDSGLGLSRDCLNAAERIESGELADKLSGLLEWVAAERPAGRDFEQKQWLAGFVHGVLEPEAEIPTT